MHAGTNNVAKIQRVMNHIGACCLITIGIWVVIILCVQFANFKHECLAGAGKCQYSGRLFWW
jgi:H+-transporting ATPase